MNEDDLNAAVEQVKHIPRVRFECDLGEGAETWLKKKHAGGAVHEPATLAAFLAIDQHFHPKVIYDVGALWGYFTLFALQACQYSEKVVAFEMHPGSLEALLRNVRPFADVVQAVVSDRCEENVKFWISGFNLYEEPEGGWEKLEEIPGAMKPRGPDNRGRGFASLDVITLDAWAEAFAGEFAPPGLIKIDVEGYQAKAIAGAMGIIRQHRPALIVELHDPEKLARFGISNRHTVQPLFDLGYSAFWCGNFRDADARFERVSDELGPQHEKLSIMVFVP